MGNKLFFTFMVAASILGASAQDWNREDSVWLQKIIERNEDIHLNDDILKAIRDGILIAPLLMKEPGNSLLSDIERQIENVTAKNSFYDWNIDPYAMLPSVFALYVLYIDKLDSINAARTILLTHKEQNELLRLSPYFYNVKSVSVRDFNPKTMPIFSFNYDYMRFVSNLIASGGGSGGGGGFGIVCDMNHLFSMAFSPYYRRLTHNKKHATAYKNYYDENGYKSIRLTEQERNQLRNAINLRLNKKRNVSFGSKSNPIDN